MNKFTPKINHKKIKKGDETSKFREIAKAYSEWVKELENFHNLPAEQQKEFVVAFGEDVQVLVLALQDYYLRVTMKVNED